MNDAISSSHIPSLYTDISQMTGDWNREICSLGRFGALRRTT